MPESESSASLDTVAAVRLSLVGSLWFEVVAPAFLVLPFFLLLALGMRRNGRVRTPAVGSCFQRLATCYKRSRMRRDRSVEMPKLKRGERRHCESVKGSFLVRKGEEEKSIEPLE